MRYSLITQFDPQLVFEDRGPACIKSPMSIQGYMVFVCLATVDYCVEAEDVIVLCATMRFTYTCIFTYYKTVEGGVK